MELYAAVGVYFAFDPVICGGYFEDDSGGHSSNKCYKYTKSEWQDFTEMIYKRHFSSGIVYKDSLHIFGGGDFETGRILQSTEIISYDGDIRVGTDLPIPLYFHAMTSVNDHVSIITGGETNENSNLDLTWYYDHHNQEFAPGPTLLAGRKEHAAGTVVDLETNQKIPVVTGGYNGEVMDSTELLLNGEWQRGNCA